MKLALKLSAAMVAGILLVHVVFALARVRREAGLFESDLRSDHRALGFALAVAAARVWSLHDAELAREVVNDTDMDHDHVAIRFLELSELPDDGSPSPRASIASHEALARVERHAGTGRLLRHWSPVVVDDRAVAAVETSESLAAEQAYLRASVAQATLAASATVVLTGTLVLLLGVLVVGRPIRRLVSRARLVAEGDLSGKLELKQADEIGLLATEIDQMCDRLAEARDRLAAETEARIRALEQLRHADRLATVGILASGIAHELGTPLNVTLGRAQMIASGEAEGEEAAAMAVIIAEQSKRMARIIRQLLDFARMRPPKRAETDLARLARETASLLEPLATKRGVELRVVSPAAPVTAEVDEAQLQQALTNVMVNGIQSMDGGGEVVVTVDRPESGPPDAPAGSQPPWVRLRVADRGAGIAEEDLPRVFDPFFTTKEVGTGTGLGLSVTHAIVRDHGGRIEVASTPGEGTEVTVSLPATGDEDQG